MENVIGKKIYESRYGKSRYGKITSNAYTYPQSFTIGYDVLMDDGNKFHVPIDYFHTIFTPRKDQPIWYCIVDNG